MKFVTLLNNRVDIEIMTENSVTHAHMQFEYFGGLFQCQNPRYMGRKCDNKDGDLIRAHLFLRASRHKGVTLQRGTLQRLECISFKTETLFCIIKTLPFAMSNIENTMISHNMAKGMTTKSTTCISHIHVHLSSNNILLKI